MEHISVGLRNRDIVFNVALYLPIRDIRNFCQTCKFYNNIIHQNEELWRQLVIRDYGVMEKFRENTWKCLYCQLKDIVNGNRADICRFYPCIGIIKKVTFQQKDSVYEYFIVGNNSGGEFSISFCGDGDTQCCEEFDIDTNFPMVVLPLSAPSVQEVAIPIKGFEIIETKSEEGGFTDNTTYKLTLLLVPVEEKVNKYRLGYQNTHNGYYAHKIKLVYKISPDLSIKKSGFI